MLNTFRNAMIFLVGLSITKPLMCGKYTNAFLQIGVGPRALGMGGSYCSLADDGHAFYWNPAGLALLRRPRLSGMYGPQFGTISNPLGSYHFVGYAQPISGDVVLAINWIRLSVDDIPIYSSLQGDSYLDRLRNKSLRPTGEAEGFINDVEDAYFFSFAKRNEFLLDLGWLYHKVRIDVPFGINLKWIKQSIGDKSGTGLGMDAGMQLRIHVNDIFQTEKLGITAFGIQVQDITRTALHWNTRHQDSAPINIKWGISYQSPLPLKNNTLVFSFDRDTKWDNPYHIGFEYCLYQTLALRIGSNDGQFTGGAGLRFKAFQIDYAFLTHSLDSLHRLGCSFSF